MLNELMSLYKGTNMTAPIAEGLKTFNVAMGDCNCVDGDCSNCD
jgi:hypothetical protein